MDNGTFDFIITLPKLDFIGKYSLKIRILRELEASGIFSDLSIIVFVHVVLDIQGKGDMDGSFENSRARVKMVSKKYVKNSQTYIKFEKFSVSR